ncbi:MAG: tetratricopeptide repeat-containing sensor histidine kinase [Bacteroidales bacterium]|nr:tetratricopeptide repeat-containing sensor histidine kinase [Bacteroidales bacterium]MCF8388992.1 tetratricopeptide repeat-containing sensor histidine kinase [Bacteroidales bacterium]MCF8397853.1 tetratricopeptide repeat-containing sensor histidine kinase [Bacteroidales bacterium]
MNQTRERNRPEEKKEGVLTRWFLYTLLILSVVLNTTTPTFSNDKTDSLKKILKEQNEQLSDSLTIELLTELGTLFKYHNPDSAIHYYKKANKIAREHGYSLLEAKTSNAIGGALYVKGEYYSSLEYFYKALELYEKMGYIDGIAISYNNIGIIQNMQDDLAGSIKNHLKSIEICRKNGDSLLWARNMHNLGIAYNSKKNHDSALHYARSSMKMFLDIGNEFESIRVNNLMGEIYLRTKKFEKVKEVSFVVINKENYKNNWERTYAMLNLAKAEYKLENFNQSITWGLKAYELALKINAKWDLREVTGILSKAYESVKKWDKALHFQRLHKEFADSIFNEQKEKEINYLQLKRKQAENKVLREENFLKQERLEKKNNQILAIVIVGVLLVIIALILYRNIILKTKLNRHLSNQNKEIEQKNKELSELNAMKDTLIRIIAHDLKNPISLMISSTDLLSENLDEMDQETMKEFMQKLNVSSREGFKLLENLLDWAYSQSRSYQYKPVVLDMEKITLESIHYLMSSANQKNISIQNHVDPEINPSGDRNMMATIVRNLLANAIKFTAEGGNIKIESGVENQSYTYCVVDNGIGIKKEKINTLFTFDENKTSRGTNNEKGTGLGLIICKEFVEKQGGRIRVESEEGKGSRFCFTIPL